MRRPLRSWKNLLGKLGLQVVEKPASHSRMRQMQRQRTIESLEDRSMMTITSAYTASTNTLQIDSNTASDTVTVGTAFDNGINAYAVTINGNTLTSGGSAVAAASLQHLFVYGNDGNDTLDLSAVSSTQFNSALDVVIDGGAGADTIKGSQLADRIIGGTGNDSLTGNAGNDTYVFDPAVGNLGTDTITEAGGVAVDTLDFSAFTTAITVDLSVTTSQTVSSGTLSLQLSSNTGLENVIGGSGNDTITGNTRDNVLTGGAGNDTLSGGTANDTLLGQAGNDTLSGGTGNDTLDGSTGDDSLTGDAGNDTYRFNVVDGNLGTDTVTEAANADTDTLDLSSFTTDVTINLGLTSSQTILSGALALTLSSSTGIENATTGSGNDTLLGNSRDNLLTGNGGNDSFEGKAGNDTLVGGAGNDTYKFDPSIGNFGSDTITESANLDTDTLDFSSFSAGISVNIGTASAQTVSSGVLTLTLSSTGGLENVIGGSGDDTITGNGRDNVLTGGNGNDTLGGSTANDTLRGQAGNDTLLGGTGNDTLDGGTGDDSLSGESGSDTFLFDAADGNLGTDTVTEAANLDVDTLDFSSFTTAVTLDLNSTSSQTVSSGVLVLSLSSGTGIENVTGGSGNDSLAGNSRDNTLMGGAGNDALAGSTGNDTYKFDPAVGNLGTDTLTEAINSGTDTLDFSAFTTGVVADLSSTATQTASSGVLSLVLSYTNFENATGGSGNDTLTGNSGNNVLLGNAGNDTLIGLGANDKLTGGAGNDSLQGGSGIDNYYFSGSTSLGSDTIVENVNDGVDIIDLSGLGSGATLDLGSTSTQTVNSLLSLTLSSAVGIETLNGTSFDDILTGNSLVNIISGTGGNDIIDGGDGDDQLDGGAGNDTVRGGAGNDKLIGSGGDDTLAGGTGNDLYSYTGTSDLGSDIIDEKSGEGNDTADLSNATSTAALNVDSGVAQALAANLAIQVKDGANLEYATPSAAGDSADDTFTVAGTPGTNVPVMFTYVDSLASYKNQVYVYIDGQEATTKALLFTSNDDPIGKTVTRTYAAGTVLSLYIVQHGGVLGSSGRKFFTNPASNPGGQDQVRTTDFVANQVIYNWEDLSSYQSNPNNQTYDGDFNDVVVSVLTPQIDLDVDSNNDGTIDPNNIPGVGTDDPIEENAPGRTIKIGELTEVKLSSNVSASTFSGSQYIPELTLAVSNPNLLVFTDPAGTEALALNNGTFNWVYGTNDPPSSLWVKGLVPLEANLKVELYYHGDIIGTDQAVVTVAMPAVNLSADSNNDGTVNVTLDGDDDSVEMDQPGAVVFVNSNNENGDDAKRDWKLAAGAFAGETDLREIKINIDAPVPPSGVTGWSAKLKFSRTDLVNVYQEATRTNLVALTGDSITLDAATYFGGSQKSLFLEGIDDGKLTITLEVTAPNGQVTNDEIRVNVIEVDADVNSNNSKSAFDPPDRNDIEEDLEIVRENNRQGRFVPANHEDIDGDGIGDFNDLQTPGAGSGFTPVVIDLGSFQPADFPNAKLRIYYDHYLSENEITNTQLYDNQTLDKNDLEARLSGNSTALRIWTKNETAMRMKADLEIGGDVVNFDHPRWYELSKFNFPANGATKITLYVEGLHDTDGPSYITAYLDTQGNNQGNDDHPDAGDYSDTVLVKVSRIDMDIDSDNRGGSMQVPARTVEQDLLEAHADKPGKILFSNVLDQDNDGISDYKDAQVTAALTYGYTPIKITLPNNLTSQARIKFTFEEGTTTNDILTPGVRLWTKQLDQARQFTALTANGHLIPNNGWFDANQLTADADRTVTIYVEGLGALVDGNGNSRSSQIRVDIDPLPIGGANTNKGIHDIITVSVTGVDLDVDSDNTKRTITPERDQAEEQIEHLLNDPQYPGKFTLLNQRDYDKDGVWDTLDQVITGGAFVPVVIQRPQMPTPPSGGSTATQPEYRYRLKFSETYLRLWTKDAASLRSFASITNGGNVLENDKIYTWSELGGGSSAETLTLYVEGQAISSASETALQGQQPITLELLEYRSTTQGGTEEGSGQSSSTSSLVSYDKIVVNVVNEFSVAAINKYAMEPSSTSSPQNWELRDPAEFRLSRGTGNTQGLVSVYFQVYLNSQDLRFASLNDYEFPKINRSINAVQVGNYFRADLLPGQSFVDIAFFPTQDSTAEWDEEIRINLVQNPQYFVGMNIDNNMAVAPYSSTVTSPFYFLAAPVDPDNPNAIPYTDPNYNKNQSLQAKAVILDANSDIAFPFNRNRDVESTGLTPAAQSNGTVAVGLQSGDVTFVLPLAPGGWGPTYNSDDNLRPLLPIQIDIPYGGTPTEISVELNVGGIENPQAINFTPGPNGFPTSGSGYNFMVMAQESLASKLSSGHYDYFATFNIKVGGETNTRTIRGKTEIVNRVDNALGMTDFGKRWWPEMLDRIIPTDGVNAINNGSQQDLSRTQQGLAAYYGQTLVRGDNTTAFSHGYNPVTENVYSSYEGFENQIPTDQDSILSDRSGLELSGAGKRQEVDQAKWQLSGLNAGQQYQIYVTWEPGLDRASNAAYKMSGLQEVGNTYTTDKTIIVDQRYTPGEMRLEGGKAWRLLGTYVATGSAEVILSTFSNQGGYATGLVHAGDVLVIKDWTYETPQGSYNYLNQGDFDGDTKGYYKGLANAIEDDFTLLAKTGTRYTFDEFGLLKLVQDRNENRTEFVYDERKLSSVTSQGGLVTQYVFADEHLDKIIDFAGRETDYDIVGGLLEAIHEPSTATNAPVTNFAYYGENEDFQLKKVTNARGDKTEIEYDSIAHRAKKITNPDSVGNTHSAQTMDGYVIFSERAWQVRPEFVSSLTSATAAKVFDAANGDLTDNMKEGVAKYTDALNNVWRYQLDQFGGVIFSSDSVNGPSVVWKTERRAKDGLADKFIEPQGGGGIDNIGPLTTEYKYDDRGNLNKLNYADSTEESWVYNQQLAVLAQATDQLSRVTTYGLDSRGNVNTITINSNSYAGDGASTLTVRNSTEYTAAPNTIDDLAGGLVTLITQPSAAGGTVETKYEYYGFGSGTSIGLVQHVHQAFGSGFQQTTSYNYDQNANPEVVTDYRGNGTFYEYDDLDQLIHQQSPNGDAGNGAEIKSQYDDMGNLISQEIVGIVAKTYGYDGMGRAIKESQGPRVITISAYDANGNLVDNKKLVGDNKYAFTHSVYDSRDLLVEQYIADPKTGDYISSNYATKNIYDVLGNVEEVRSNRFKQNTSGNYELDTAASNVIDQYAYDKLGRVTSQGINVTSSQSIVQAYGYYHDGMQEWSSVTDEDGVLRTTNIAYDDFGREVKVELPDPDGGSALSRPTTTKTYFDDGSLKSETVQGRTTDYTYDALGRLKTKELPAPGASAGGGAADHGRPKFEYFYNVLGSNLEVVEKDPRAYETKTIYDANDRLYQNILPAANTGHAEPTTTYAYYSFGEIQSVSIPVINEVGGTAVPRTTNYTYDDYGFIDYVTTPQGQLDYTYDAAGNKIASLDYSGNATTFEYDYHANLIKVTQPTVDAGTPITKFEYDTAGNRTKLSVPGPAYDNAGPVFLTSTISYDAFNRQISLTDHLGQTTTSQYYLTGELKSQTTSTISGTADDRVTSYKYDRLGRQTEITNPLNEKTKFAYNDQGLLLSLTDSANNKTEYGYDDLGRKITETTDVQREFGGSIISAARHWHYDANGNVVQYKNRDGEIQKFKYDALNRRYQETWENVSFAAAAGFTATWQYNEVGEMLSDSDTRNAATISEFGYDYNTAGQLGHESFNFATPEQTVTGQWTYGYDTNGNRNAVALSNSNLGGTYRVDTQYDALNRVKEVSQVDLSALPNDSSSLKAQTHRFTNTLNGQLKSRTAYARIATPSSPLEITDGVVDAVKSYDANGQLDYLKYIGPSLPSNPNTGGLLLKYDYTQHQLYPALIAGLSTEILIGNTYIPNGTNNYDITSRTYNYDADGQLGMVTTIHGIDISTDFINHDANGQKSNGVYGKDNRLFYDGISWYKYDLEGRRVWEEQAGKIVVVDDEDPNYSDNSVFTPWGITTEGAYNNDQRYWDDDDTNYTFTYTSPDALKSAGVLGPGSYRISVTWTPLQNQVETTQARIVIRGINAEHPEGEILGVTLVDQTNYPNDQVPDTDFYSYKLGGQSWRAITLDTKATNSTYTSFAVDIKNDTDEGILLADAVKFERVSEQLTYSWDPRNRLIQAEKSTFTNTNTSAFYTYDVNDRLTSSGVGPSVESLSNPRIRLYDGANVAVIYDNAGRSSAQTLHMLWQPQVADQLLSISSVRDNTPVIDFTMSDAAGTLQRTIDNTGLLSDMTSSDPFGRVNFGPANHLEGFAFAGQEVDQYTGLQYSRARWYDGQAQIFVSQDPMSFAAGDTNLYSRTGNDPVNHTDPSGHVANIIGGAIIGGIIGGAAAWWNNQDILVGIAAGGISGALAGATFGASLAASTTIGGFALASAGAGAVAGGVNGAILGGANAYIAGGNSSDVIKSGLKGGLIGSAAGALGGAVGGAAFGGLAARGFGQLTSFVGSGAIGGAAGGGLGGGLSAAVEGQSFVQGAWQGATQGAVFGAAGGLLGYGAVNARPFLYEQFVGLNLAFRSAPSKHLTNSSYAKQGYNTSYSPEMILSQSRNNIGFIPKGKTVAANGWGERTSSGWAVRSGCCNNEQLTLAAHSFARKMGVPFESHFRDSQFLEGSYFASHAEVQMSFLADTFAVSKPMCPSCRNFMSTRAQFEQRSFTISDPSTTWIFSPNKTSWTRQQR